jgi:hypothetical protein
MTIGEMELVQMDITGVLENLHLMYLPPSWSSGGFKNK